MYPEIDFINNMIKGKNIDVDKFVYDFLWKNKLYYLMSRIEKYHDLKLELLFEYNKRNINKMYMETQEIFCQLNKSNIKYAVIKGAVLAGLAYGGIEYRTSTDIDILVDKKDIWVIENILQQNGYIQGYVDDMGNIQPFGREKKVYNDIYMHQTLPYVKKIDNTKDGVIMFDINTTILWTETIEFDVRLFLKNRICDMQICENTIKCCDALGNFLVTCMHHYKDLNSDFLLLKNGFNMNMFTDIYYLLVNNQHMININELNIVLDKLKIGKYIYYCLFYVNQIFHNVMIEGYIKKIKFNDDMILESYGFDDMMKKWTISFSERFDYEKMSNDIISNLTRSDLKRIEILKYMLKG